MYVQTMTLSHSATAQEKVEVLMCITLAHQLGQPSHKD